MNKVIIDIQISNEDYLKQYTIANCMVNTYSRDGRSIQFPANILRRFLLHTGIRGTFSINFDNTGKFTSIERC